MVIRKKVIEKLSIEQKNVGENYFLNNHPQKHDLVKWPFTFFVNGYEYTPDFLDLKTMIFYEIIGTAARYYQGQNKALSVRKALGIKLVFCKPDGTVLIPRFTARGKSYLITGSKKFRSCAPNSEYIQETQGLTTYGGKRESKHLFDSAFITEGDLERISTSEVILD